MQSASGITGIFSDNMLTKDLAKFIRRCQSIKFPEDDAKESAVKVTTNDPAEQA